MQTQPTLYGLAKSGIMDIGELDGIETAVVMSEVMAKREVKLTKRQEAIIAGLIGDRTPDAYRRQRLLDDLDGMAAIGGYVPDYFCDTRIAERLVDEGRAERIIAKTKPKQIGYRAKKVPF